MGIDIMKTLSKNALASVTIFLFLGMTVSPMIASGSISDASDTEKELYLLYGKTNFTLYALENVDSFNAIHTIPPNYENQAPIFFNIRDETTADIISYQMYNDTSHPNKVINFTIGPMNKKEKKTICFEYWVFVKKKDYKDLPDYVEMPSKDELPDDTKLWLASTNAIQANNTLIKLKAQQLRRKSDNNLLSYADNIVWYTRYAGRPSLFMGKYHTIMDYVVHGGIPNILWRLSPNKFQYLPKWLIFFGNIPIPTASSMYQDAVSTLLSCGVCSGVANLGTALFRASGIPAKHLLLTPVTFYRYELYICHCICEFYCPGYGWVWAETTEGTIGNEIKDSTKDSIVLRVSTPQDENAAGSGLQGFGGLEQWAWITNKNVARNLDTMGKREGAITAVGDVADGAFNVTQAVWDMYTRNFGRELDGENERHFLNATAAQQNAIKCFKQSDFNGYFDNIIIAYDEYNMIDCS